MIYNNKIGSHKNIFLQKLPEGDPRATNLCIKIEKLKNDTPVYHQRDKDITLAMPHMAVAHCISEDRAQTKGIAKAICEKCPANKQVYFVPVGHVSITRSGQYVIFNLVTKKKYHEKPSYDSLDLCLKQFRDALLEEPSVTKIAIPELGCGLDLLKWTRVLPMIKAALKGLPLDVYIYKI